MKRIIIGSISVAVAALVLLPVVGLYGGLVIIGIAAIGAIAALKKIVTPGVAVVLVVAALWAFSMALDFAKPVPPAKIATTAPAATAAAPMSQPVVDPRNDDCLRAKGAECQSIAAYRLRDKLARGSIADAAKEVNRQFAALEVRERAVTQREHALHAHAQRDNDLALAMARREEERARRWADDASAEALAQNGTAMEPVLVRKAQEYALKYQFARQRVADATARAKE